MCRLMALLASVVATVGAIGPSVSASTAPPPPPVEVVAEAPDVAPVLVSAAATANRLPDRLQLEPLAAPPENIAPPNSGSGRRIVYSKNQMRVWIVEADETVTRTYRVSGRLNQPLPGTYEVWSRATYTCASKHPDICMRWMVRFAHSFSGDNIGFHEIPRRGGVPLQSEEDLGMALSGGCVRQATIDAMFMWDWAQMGTTVVVYD